MDAFTWAKDIESLNRITRPDMHTQRVAWNRRWEEDLARVYNEKILIYHGLRRTQHTRKSREFEKGATQEMLLITEEQKKATFMVQVRVEDRAVKKALNGDLEGRWKKMADGRRKEIILEAIYRTASLPGGLERERKYCPDVTIPSLSAHEGKLFIDWLRLIISARRSLKLSDLQPVLFPHPLLDKILEEMDLEVFRRVGLVMRSYYISFVLWYILLAIYDDPDFSHSGVTKSAKHVGITKFAYQAAEKMYGKEIVRSVKKEYKEYLAEWQVAYACNFCNKKSGPSTGITLKACVRCKEIGRIVRYCSRECQIQDWKNIVRPHKKTCGKLLELDDSFEPKSVSAPEGMPMKIPEPAPTFERSLALEHQLNLIHFSNADYTLVATDADVDEVEIDFPTPHYEDTSDNALQIYSRVGFLIARRRAFINGDSAAVNTMFRACIPILERRGIPAERLAIQLEREFGIEVDDNFDRRNTTLPTEDEIEWAFRLISLFEIIEEFRAEGKLGSPF